MKAASQSAFHPDRLDQTGQAVIQNHLENGVTLKDALVAAGITREIALQKAQELDRDGITQEQANKIIHDRMQLFPTITEEALKETLKEELKIAVHPPMDEERAVKTIAKLRKRSSRAVAAFWRQIAREWDFDRPYHGVEIIKDYPMKTETGTELQNRVFVMHRKTIKRKATTPVLMIDADANIEINRLLFGSAMEEVVIKAKLNTHVIQVYSSVFTKTSLLSDNANSPLPKVAKFIQEEVAKANGGGVLVVTNKKVREKLTCQKACDDLGRPTIATMWCGAIVTHFGVFLGVDSWKDFKTVIILGREQPWPEQVERIGRALYWDQVEPLTLIGEYTHEPRGYQVAGGQLLGVNSIVHPDPRIQGVLELVRERQSGQALARLRMVHSAETKRVIVMCSLPLDIQVDELLTTNELFNGGSPLMQVWKQLPGILPLSALWLVENFPKLFGSIRNANYLISNEKQMCKLSYIHYMKVCTFNFRLEGARGVVLNM